MASIFTFDPDPPRVSSPWLAPLDSASSTPPRGGTPRGSTPRGNSSPDGKPGEQRQGPARSSLASESANPRLPSFSNLQSGTPPPELLEDYGMTKLDPEPQDGPQEYKLHLLLRPRRTYSSTSTNTYIAGRHTYNGGRSEPPVLAPSNQSKQSRLQQLTTQLLWRLQQSSPYHASSASDLVLPRLPDATRDREGQQRPGKLPAGLEESRGALYEIGVSDDGAFVGLTADEMDESLGNLKAMAASLGCTVEILRMVMVGDCVWHEKPASSNESRGSPTRPLRREDKLWVAEALVKPDPRASRVEMVENEHRRGPSSAFEKPLNVPIATGNKIHQSSTPQLRVTLTGPTTSGKSSLLGTLSTATLDNGRGKSRLSLLKHRHELASGVTSSVAQELLGYRKKASSQDDIHVVNYASGNVTSWTDIHASAEDGRLVFVSDSAGHPRYRRTTVRGLIGWAPHWTFLCIGADDGDSTVADSGRAQEVLGVAGAGIDLAKAHLELCLKLEKPLAVVITKLDLASKTSLRATLSKVLTALKAAGRTPVVLPPDQTKNIVDEDLISVPSAEEDIIRTRVTDALNNPSPTSHESSAAQHPPHIATVPIIFTSAVKGHGIRMLHALLNRLPIPPPPTSHDYVGAALNPEQPSCLFHIEDVFAIPASYAHQSHAIHPVGTGTVIAGYLRFGDLSIGDKVVIGPFPADSPSSDDSPFPRSSYKSPPSAHASHASHASHGSEASMSYMGSSFPHSSSVELARVASRSAVSASTTKGEWHDATIVSIRNLRLPVQKLESGQMGTIGIVFESETERPLRIRKGMVCAVPTRHMGGSKMDGQSKVDEVNLQAASGFTASFEDEDVNSLVPGMVLVVYIASIRASAKVVRICPHVNHSNNNHDVHGNGGDDEYIFGFGGEEADGEGEEGREAPVWGSDGVTDVTLELMTSREWIELGSQVLIMPGGGHGLYYGSERGEKGVAGLEGFVGRVVEVVD